MQHLDFSLPRSSIVFVEPGPTPLQIHAKHAAKSFLFSRPHIGVHFSRALIVSEICERHTNRGADDPQDKRPLDLKGLMERWT
jgi:hypothetical protein